MMRLLILPRGLLLLIIIIMLVVVLVVFFARVFEHAQVVVVGGGGGDGGFKAKAVHVVLRQQLVVGRCFGSGILMLLRLSRLSVLLLLLPGSAAWDTPEPWPAVCTGPAVTTLTLTLLASLLPLLLLYEPPTGTPQYRSGRAEHVRELKRR